MELSAGGIVAGESVSEGEACDSGGTVAAEIGAADIQFLKPFKVSGVP